MKRVVARQTQFPVGQGGLHLCKVWMPQDNRTMPYFSMVFDCGGQGNPAALDRGMLRLRGSLAQRGAERVLDLLVLSHLHADHINGFKRLTSGPRLRINRLLLPHYDEQAIALLLAQTAAETGSADILGEMATITSDIPGWFVERGVEQIISLDPDDQPEAPPFPEVPLDGSPAGLEPWKAPPPPDVSAEDMASFEIWTEGSVITSADASRTRLPSRALMTVRDRMTGETCWVFLPYARQQAPSGGHGDRTRLRQAVDTILGPYRHSGKLVLPFGTGQQVVDDLAKAYRAYTPASKWNDISLTLASGVPSGSSQRIYRFSDRPWWSPGSVERSSSWFWMHTGDAILGGLDGQAWRTRFRHYLPQLSLFQAPHHGSRHNLDDLTIAQLPTDLLAFVTARDGDAKHPHPEVARMLHANGNELWTVSQDRDSELATWIEVIFR